MLVISNFDCLGVEARKLLPALRFDGFSKFIASVLKPINGKKDVITIAKVAINTLPGSRISGFPLTYITYILNKIK